jgi:hypothetical protein
MTYKPEGIFHLTGEPDTGKTIAALGAYHPSQTAYFFDDVKKPPIDEKEFSGGFIDLVAKYSNLKMLEFYQAMRKEIDNLKPVDCIIFDTWSRFGKSIRYYAKANPFEFREASTFSPNGTIKNMEQWGETHRVEADIISLLSQKCKALFLITHIKPQIMAGARTGSYEPDCGKSFNKVCNMRLWLRHNPDGGVPISLVLKRISKITVTENGIEPINVLPRKMIPAPNFTSIWESINFYWGNPVGNNEPKEYEIPSPFELSILDGILTDDQKEMWQAELREKNRQEKEVQDFLDTQYDEVKTFVNELAQAHNGLPKIAIAGKILPEVQEKYSGYTQSDVVEMIGD